MRIFRLTYEEIDTEDKFNPATNTKLTCQQTISDYELAMLYPHHDKEYIKCTQQKIFETIMNQI
jgi:hypothetical protein